MANWFKQKRYGYGATPSTWQGWALTGVYLIIMIGLSLWLTEGAAQAQTRALPFFALVAVVTMIFVAIVFRTTEGGWRWRWGDDEKR